MSNAKILFQLTGSIAGYKACHVISRLVQAGHEVEVVASPSALQFIGPATLEGLTGRPVHSDTFARGGAMDHIHLIRWADLVVICPATANTINKMVNGVGDDLVSTLFLAHDFKKPFIIAPAMNTMMYRHPATQKSLKTLREWGIEVLEPEAGALACGEVGEGRLLEPDLILKRLIERIAALSRHHTSDSNDSVWSESPSMRVLITSGGTREPLDGVRAITNFSTGRTGASLAEYFRQQGAEVTFLHAEGSALPQSRTDTEAEIETIKATGAKPLSLRSFATFRDLEQSLKQELSTKSYDAVIHLAAVGDYSVDKLEYDGRVIDSTAKGKIDSGDQLTIHLKRNPKLVDHLREFSLNKAIRVVAFKLTNTSSDEEQKKAVAKLASHAQPNWIVHNDLSAIHGQTEGHAASHKASIYDPHVSLEKPIRQTTTKFELAIELENLLRSSLDSHFLFRSSQK
jgi:phosphopantothenoylcysteine decarboxylase/phosphopantothenate--cysteine ligase